MAVQPVPQSSEQPPAKKRRSRSPSVAKPAFFIIQVLDDNGQPMPFDKKRVKIVSVERNAETVMELVESGNHQHAFYLRGIVPVARQAAPRTAAPQAA